MKVSVFFLLFSLFFVSNHLTFASNCRRQLAFPFVSCEGTYSTNSTDETIRKSKCSQGSQFGCTYNLNNLNGFSCTLDPKIATSNECPNNEIPARKIQLKHKQPVEFEIAFRIPLEVYKIDIVLLIDRTNSTRANLKNVMPELKSLVRNLPSFARIGIATYGAEKSQDDETPGLLISLSMTNNLDTAINALDQLPITPDGPRTTIRALNEIRYNGYRLMKLNGLRKAIILLGDTPGREVSCSASSKGPTNSLVDYVRGIAGARLYEKIFSGSLIAGSIGKPGLDASQPPFKCETHKMTEAVAPIKPGQASRIATSSNGEIVSKITANKLLSAVLAVRRKAPHVRYSSTWGNIVTITSNSTQVKTAKRIPGISRTTNGCDERVKMEILKSWPETMRPVAVDPLGRVRLELSPDACRNGSFICEITIKETTIGIPFRGPYPFGHRSSNISVCACGERC